MYLPYSAFSLNGLKGDINISTSISLPLGESNDISGEDHIISYVLVFIPLSLF
jgi:hypothetical protein